VKGAQTVRIRVRRLGVEELYHRHRGLLRPRRERPHNRRAAEHPEKFPPSHQSNPKQSQRSDYSTRKRPRVGFRGMLSGWRPDVRFGSMLLKKSLMISASASI
jgi:hypothetical protein